MNNGKVLSTIGIFIIAPVMMFAYITGPGPDKGYDRCPDGYEPHLYKNGLCLYESISMRLSANAALESDSGDGRGRNSYYDACATGGVRYREK